MSMMSEDFIQKAIDNPSLDIKCNELHPGMSCNEKFFKQFLATSKSVYKMYLLVHLIPFVIFKRKKLRKQPIKELKNLIVGFVKSLLFAGGYIAVVRKVICLMTQYHRYGSLNGPVSGFIGGITLAFEPKGRQSQIALFCVNKTIQTLYHMGLRRKYRIRIPHGQCLVAGLAIGLICFHFVNCPESIRQNYLKVLNRIIGNV